MEIEIELLASTHLSPAIDAESSMTKTVLYIFRSSKGSSAAYPDPAEELVGLLTSPVSGSGNGKVGIVGLLVLVEVPTARMVPVAASPFPIPYP